MEKLIAFNGDKKVKAQLVAQLEAHYKADDIIKGIYWEGGKGCAVGCTVHSGNHSLYESMYGIPEQLAHLEDRIFEGLPNSKSKGWPLKFIKAIKVGADLSLVWPKFIVAELKLLKKYTKDYPDCRKAIETVIDLWTQAIRGEMPSKEAFNKAAEAAARAAKAAEAAAEAAAAEAAAAEAAANAVWYMASVARVARAAYQRMANRLIKLLKAA